MRIPVGTYRSPSRIPPVVASQTSVRRTEEERIAAQRQREHVLQKLSSFFGADDDEDDDDNNDKSNRRDHDTERDHPLRSSSACSCEDNHKSSPTSVFHLDHPQVLQLYQKKMDDVNVSQPLDNNKITSIDQDNYDDHRFKPLQRYHSLPNSGTAATTTGTAGSTFLSSRSRNSSKSSLKQSGSSRSLKGNVSFSNLSIREYNVEIGDNPSCSYGVPISLGWDYEEHHESLALSDDDWDDDGDHYVTTSSNAWDLATATPLVTNGKQERGEYETQPTTGSRGMRRTKTKKKKPHELLLSYNDRRRLLKRAGYSQKELKECLETVQRVKLERGMTELFLAAAPLEDAMETVVQGVQDFFRSVVTGSGSNNQRDEDETNLLRTTTTWTEPTIPATTTATDIESSSAGAAAAAMPGAVVEKSSTCPKDEK